jgi:hypothetical protein
VSVTYLWSVVFAIGLACSASMSPVPAKTESIASIPTPTAISHSAFGLPLFSRDGDTVFATNIAPGTGAQTIDLLWLSRTGKIAARRRTHVDGYVQSVYAAPNWTVWFLVATPRLPHDLTTHRQYTFVGFTPHGYARAPWPAERETTASMGGLWMSRGVYWTYNTFDLLQPLGLNWADLAGRYHAPDDVAVPLAGDPSNDLAVGAYDTLWTSVATHDPGTLAPDGVVRIGVRDAKPNVRRFALPAHVDVAFMTQDSANDEWFAFRDGTVGFVDQSGSVRIFHRHAANSYPIAIVAAPSDGVWLLDTVTVERFDRRGRIDVERAPAAWRHLRFPVSATMSPCGVLWLLQLRTSIVYGNARITAPSRRVRFRKKSSTIVRLDRRPL